MRASSVDNGSEFISKVLDKWAYEHQVALVFSRPGKPTDNAYIESFNGSFRHECSNVHWFLSLEDAKIKAENWRQDYNLIRPHSALNYLTPTEFSEQSTMGISWFFYFSPGVFKVAQALVLLKSSYVGFGHLSLLQKN